MNAENIIQTSSEDIRTLLREADHFLANSADAADDKVKALRQRLRATIDEGRSRYERVRESARAQAMHCDTYVREHPYRVIGTAVAIGTLTGFLLGRRT